MHLPILKMLRLKILSGSMYPTRSISVDQINPRSPASTPTCTCPSALSWFHSTASLLPGSLFKDLPPLVWHERFGKFKEIFQTDSFLLALSCLPS